MEPVLGLVPDDALRAFQDVIGDLLPPVGGEAVHNRSPGHRQFQEPGVDRVSLERLQPFGRFMLVTHRDPYIGVEDVCVANRLLRLGEDGDTAAGRPRPLNNPVLGAVARRACNHNLHPGQWGGEDPCVADVVPIAYPGEFEAAEIAEPFAEGHDIGENLAWVQPVR